MTSKQSLILRWTGLSLIGAYVLLAALYGSFFAKWHVDVQILGLPFFIGELVCFLTAAIFFILYRYDRQPGQEPYEGWLLLLVYIAMMVIFTSKPYFGLSLRNAAMYYYAFIGLFTFHFLRGIKFLPIVRLVAALFFIMGCVLIPPFSYFRYSFIVLGGVMLARMPRQWFTGLLTLLFVVVARPDNIFWGPRTQLVSSSVVLIFITVIIFGYLLPIRLRWRCLGIAAVVVSLFFFVRLKSDHNVIKSMITPQVVMQRFHQFDEQINQKFYVPQILSVHLYNPNILPPQQLQPLSSIDHLRLNDKEPNLNPKNNSIKPGAVNPGAVNAGVVNAGAVNAGVVKASAVKSDAIKLNTAKSNTVKPPDTVRLDHAESNSVAPYSLDVGYVDILFRLFIWRDMVRELYQERAWFGVGLGKPQRSPSLETLNWANTEWSRDGWITPHNLFLHLIYRSGIIGLILIIILIRSIWRMLKLFIRVRSYEGVFLISILLYWMIFSQFLVVLELPYYAIPFWFFMGLTWTYWRNLQTNELV